MSSILSAIWKPLSGARSGFPDTVVDLTGKTAIVTGSNTGLGKGLAIKFAKMKPSKLILAVRSLPRGETARSEILYLVPTIEPSSIEVWALDMADLASVKAFSERAYSSLDRLDVLVCNAGMRPVAFKETKDHWETCLQVNGMATLYLAILLAPPHAAAFYTSPSTTGLSKPHLSLISSGLHWRATFVHRNEPSILQSMNDEGKYAPSMRYNDTKLINVWSAKSLAQRVGDSIIVNSSNPGWCPDTALSDDYRKSSILVRILMAVFGTILGRTTESGVRCLAWGALSGAVNGAYASDCTDEIGSPWSNSEEGVKTQRRLWDEMIEVFKSFDPSFASDPLISL